jgi:Methyltransferase domain
MGKLRNHVMRQLWKGLDPFLGFPLDLYVPDLQGWGDGHPWLTQTIDENHPRIVAEMGVWKGASVVRMASRMKALGIEGVVIAVDTWLGSWDHWVQEHFEKLGFLNGRSTLQNIFMTNVITQGLEDYVVPLPLDSLNAVQVLRHHGIQLDLLHLDGAHDYNSVRCDLGAWWPLISPGGILIGDDYYRNGAWPGVRRAFDEFFSAPDSPMLEFGDSKCRLRKGTLR